MLLLVCLVSLNSCSDNAGSADRADSWPEVKEAVAKMDTATTYDDIVNILGKPYEEFATPSLPEEYVMYYNVPQQPDSMFWIMLDTETKKFIYWGGDKQEK